MIAHTHRVKKKNNSPIITGDYKQFNSPNSFYDFKLLMGCIFITKNVLLRVFVNEYNGIVPHLKNIKRFSTLKEIKTNEVYLMELKEIGLKVENEMDKNLI